MIETITCTDNIARETVSATGVSAISDSDGSTTLVWSAEGTSICVRRCVNGILCDGFKIGSDDLVCDGVTVSASIIIQRTDEEPIVFIGFSNGGITTFTQYGEATDMFAFYNFPVVDLKRAVINDREVLLVLHSNGILVVVSINEVLRNPEYASMKVVQLCTEEESQLFTNIEVSCIDGNLTFLVQKKTQLLSVTVSESSLFDPTSTSEIPGILTGIFNYAKSLVAPTVASPTLRRRKSSNHSIGLHQDVSEFLVPLQPSPPLIPQSTVTIIELLPPDAEFTLLTLSPTNEFVISVTNEGSVSVHQTRAPYSSIVTLKGYQVHNSVAWTSFDSFAVLSEKNMVENWKIINCNFCKKIDEKEKIIALFPITNSSRITCLMVRQESKIVRLDFSKLLLSQISGPIDDMSVAFVLSSFTRHNERQIYEQVDVNDVSLSVEILLIFLRDSDVLKNLSSEKRHLVQKECQLIELYKQVVDLYTDMPEVVVEHDHPLMIPLCIISKFYETAKTDFDFESFLGWTKSWSLTISVPDNFLDSIAIPIRPLPDHPLASYREFAHNIDSACDSILSTLVLRQSDPFIIRTVEKIFGSYWDALGKSPPTAAVQRWIFSRARRWYPEMIGNKLLRNFLKRFSFNHENIYFFENLVTLAVLDESDTFHNLLSLAPIMLGFPRCPPTFLIDNHWRLLVAVSIAFNPSSFQSIMDKLKWGDTEVLLHQHFGQFGIDNDIIDSLSEVKIVHENFFNRDVNDEIVIRKLIVLILLFKIGSSIATRVDIESLLLFFNDLPADSDKSVFGFQIISRVFPRLIVEWIETVNEIGDDEKTVDQGNDITALDSCISICRCMRADKTFDEKTTDSLIFQALSLDEIACVQRMQFLLLILRLSLSCSSPCPIRRLFHFDPKTSLIFPTSINQSAIIHFLVSLALKSRRGSQLVQPVSSELGIASIVFDQIITQLLDQCFDRDIEEFIHGVSSDQFSTIVDRVVTERISVCIKMLAEDTSRLHGVIRTILTRDEIETYLSVSANMSEKLVQEWIQVDGPRDVLVSCTRLANHPKINRAQFNGRHENVAKKLIRAIDEI